MCLDNHSQVKKHIQIHDKKECCGCGACHDICPKLAISMLFDEEGFPYPLVNESKCIECGLCEKVCPIINVQPETKKPQHGYLLQIKNEIIRHESTSGGSFTAIASWVIRQGGVVYGAAFENSFYKVAHCAATTMEELGKFRNSKYVQSDLGNIYKEIKQYLDEGKWVAMSGTPCQIEGLTRFLRKPYEKLLLIDVVCYGIPSPGLFADYMKYMHRKLGGTFKRVLFREKRLSYNYTSFSLYNEDSKLDYHKGVESEPFMRSFFSNMNVRPSCYNCKFKKRYRLSDFTIWDCYDVKRFSRNFDNLGTNRVLVHTEKGEKILNEIKSHVKLEEYMDLDYFIKDEIAMVKSVPSNPNRNAFFKDYQSMDFDRFINKWFPMSLKVKLNSLLRNVAFRLGVYNASKRLVKRLLGKH